MSEPNDAEAEAGAPVGSEPASGEGGGGAAPAQFGVTRYVHAAMIGVGILGGYVAGNLFGSLWASLAALPAAARALPILLRYGEDERSGFTLTAGAVVGLLLTVRMFRDAQIRAWADEVALELAKVVWPTRETVTNGTLVVIVATAIATVYVGLLDRLWSFVTILVYGA